MADVIPENERFIAYTATAGQTTFAYNFTAYANEDITVFQIPDATGVVAELTVNVDYTLTNVGSLGGGNITLTVAAAEDDIIIAFGSLPELRQTDYNAAGDFRKESVNTAFNRLVMICQQLRRDANRSIRLEDYDVTDPDVTNLRIPLTEDRKGKFLYFDEATGALSVQDANVVVGPADSQSNEVALFDGATGRLLKRPGTDFMILPQGTTGQRGAPGSIVLRGNTDGTEDVEVYVDGGWKSVLTGGAGGTGAPIDATYIVQQPSGVLTDEQAMSDLATGLVRNTTATGVQSIAVEGVDYYAPGLTNVAVVDGGTGASTPENARINLGLEIGTDVQAWDQRLDDISGLADPGADRILFYDNSATALDYLTAGAGTDITGTTLTSILNYDPDPTLSANLNVNTHSVVDANNNELFTFTETASAVNNLNVANSATGNKVNLSAVGDDAAIGISLTTKGNGNIALGNFEFEVVQTVGAAEDGYVLTYDNSSGLISLEAGGGGGGLTNPLTADINMNGFGLDDTNNNELVTFTETASAVNNINIANSATGDEVVISAVGDDADVGIDITPKGIGTVSLGNFEFESNQTVGAGQDNYVLTYDNTGGLISLEQAVRENTTQSWTAEQTFKELKLTGYSLAGTVIDPANGSVQYKTLGSNTTFTESLDNGQDVLLMINDGSARTITWPTITWLTDSGSAPTLKTTGYTPIYIFQMNNVLYGIRCGDGG